VKPLADWPVDARRQISGVFTDIDDTLTTGGRITADALQALADLKAAGLQVIPVTGRPVGWCQRLANGQPDRGLVPWPVDALLAENGALAFVPNLNHELGLNPSTNKRDTLLNLYQQSDSERAQHAVRMRQVAQRVLREVPLVRLPREEGGRETDLAFDYNENLHLPAETVQQVLAILHDEGMYTSVSSIHIHGCFGDFNKWQGACWLLRRLYGRDLAQELDHWVFVGDSGNDQPMFEHFAHSVGVANIRHGGAALSHWPRYVTQAERGAGFAEVARAILAVRRSPGAA